MKGKLFFFFLLLYGTTCLAQDEPFKAIVLINGVAYLVDVTPKGDITTTYQKVENYFQSQESHASIMRRMLKDPQPQGEGIAFYDKEVEPVPSFTDENKRPIDVGNDQFIGFSPGRALLLKIAVDQIRKIGNSYRNKDISSISITSFYNDNYRSRSLARNRAKAINDLLIAFGVSQNQIFTNSILGGPDAKVDFVNIGFGN